MPAGNCSRSSCSRSCVLVLCTDGRRRWGRSRRGHDVVGGCREQVIAVRDVVIYRPVPGGRAHGERPQGQSILARGVKYLGSGRAFRSYLDIRNGFLIMPCAVGSCWPSAFLRRVGGPGLPPRPAGIAERQDDVQGGARPGRVIQPDPAAERLYTVL